MGHEDGPAECRNHASFFLERKIAAAEQQQPPRLRPKPAAKPGGCLASGKLFGNIMADLSSRGHPSHPQIRGCYIRNSHVDATPSVVRLGQFRWARSSI
jgi:hypothetical protein